MPPPPPLRSFGLAQAPPAGRTEARMTTPAMSRPVQTATASPRSLTAITGLTPDEPGESSTAPDQLLALETAAKIGWLFPLTAAKTAVACPLPSSPTRGAPMTLRPVSVAAGRQLPPAERVVASTVAVPLRIQANAASPLALTARSAAELDEFGAEI